jgi:DNA invertase Pin-like site-specific DNA recombinase
MSRKNTERRLKSAAAYVKFSTDRQQCSASNQMSAIRKYAKRKGLKIVKKYSDGNKKQTGSHTA